MDIATVIIIIFVISFAWTLFTLKSEIKKDSNFRNIEKDLQKEKIIFKSD